MNSRRVGNTLSEFKWQVGQRTEKIDDRIERFSHHINIWVERFNEGPIVGFSVTTTDY